MKKGLVFVFASMMLLCGCNRLFESEKERLDRMMGIHWENWKSAGKDTANCVVDFAEVVPVEWDTMVYVDYYLSDKNIDAYNYIKSCYWLKEVDLRKYDEESIHFWKDGKLVYKISLLMASDDEKGSYFCSEKNLIKRARNDAKFHVVKKRKFYIIRDMTEEFVLSWRYVNEFYDYNQ